LKVNVTCFVSYGGIAAASLWSETEINTSGICIISFYVRSSIYLMISLKHPLMWWILFIFQVKTGDDIPMPAYFRFLALLAFKIFSDEQVNTLWILHYR
jgi:hypothetical protein